MKKLNNIQTRTLEHFIEEAYERHKTARDLYCIVDLYIDDENVVHAKEVDFSDRMDAIHYIEHMVKRHKEQVECYSIYLDGKLEELHGFPVLYEEGENETSY